MSDEAQGGGVPRGTPPPFVMSPEVLTAAQEVFGDRLELAERYHDLLASDGVEKGLIGPREVPRLWTRHLLNCAYLGELVEENAVVVDVGSGAGLPGIPLALARPDVRVQLVEPLERRYTFLREVIRELDLGERVAVARGRAEDVAGEFTGSVVTARAVAPLATLYGWTLPLCRPGGHLLAIKGRSASDEIASGAGTLQRMGVDATPEVVHCGPDDETGTTVVRLARGNGPLRAATPPGTSPAARKPRRRRTERSTTGRNEA